MCRAMTCKGVTNLIELAIAAVVSKEIELQGAAWGDHALNLLQHTSR